MYPLLISTTTVTSLDSGTTHSNTPRDKHLPLFYFHSSGVYTSVHRYQDHLLHLLLACTARNHPSSPSSPFPHNSRVLLSCLPQLPALRRVDRGSTSREGLPDAVFLFSDLTVRHLPVPDSQHHPSPFPTALLY